MQIDPDYAFGHRYLASIYTLAAWNRPDLAAHRLLRSLEIDPRQADAEEVPHHHAQKVSGQHGGSGHRGPSEDETEQAHPAI